MSARVIQGTRRARWRGRQRSEFLWALFFIAPWIIGFLAFTLGPMLASLYYSFTNYSLIHAPQWAGLTNYQKLFGGDDDVRIAIGNTIYMVIVGIPLTQLTAFGSALLLNMKVRGIPVYRTLYFLPAIMPAVPVTIVWTWVFNPDLGPINALISDLGITPPIWLNSPEWSKPTLILLGMWQVGTTMVIYLAGLQGVPTALYEAAKIDGAGIWSRLTRITIPIVSPVIAFNAIVGVIYSFQYFSQAYVASMSNNGTFGGVQNSLLFYALYLYETAFQFLDLGYASAMAWLLFVIVMAVTLVVLFGSSRLVYYETSER